MDKLHHPHSDDVVVSSVVHPWSAVGGLLGGSARRCWEVGAQVVGRVRVQAQRLPKHWLIHVDDTPPGVAEADLPRLFERLFRSDASRSRSSGGAGLGLAISKSIVDAHAGSIVAAPSPLGGLRISVHLPRSGAGA